MESTGEVDWVYLPYISEIRPMARQDMIYGRIYEPYHSKWLVSMNRNKLRLNADLLALCLQRCERHWRVWSSNPQRGTTQTSRIQVRTLHQYLRSNTKCEKCHHRRYDSMTDLSHSWRCISCFSQHWKTTTAYANEKLTHWQTDPGTLSTVTRVSQLLLPAFEILASYILCRCCWIVQT